MLLKKELGNPGYKQGQSNTKRFIPNFGYVDEVIPCDFAWDFLKF